MFTGVIEGVGPRYCPSVEDKVVRFADKLSHQIFIEPEGLDTHEIYPNGISTSLPFDVQQEFVRSIRGFEHAHITRPGYAIEYDFFDPRDLQPTLETKFVGGLVFRGADQRHDRLRGSRRAGPARRASTRACAVQGRDAVVAEAQRCLHRRAGRRPDHARRARAVPHVHEPRRIPAHAARGQRGPAPDAGRSRAGSRRRRALGVLRTQAHRRRRRTRAAAAPRGCAPARTLRRASKRCSARRCSREQRAFELLRRPEVSYDALDAALAPRRGRLARRRTAGGAGAAAGRRAGEVHAATSIGSTKRSSVSVATRRPCLPAAIDYAAVRGLSNEVRQKLIAASARDARPGRAYSRHDARGGLAAADPPEAAAGDTCVDGTRRRGRVRSRATFARRPLDPCNLSPRPLVPRQPLRGCRCLGIATLRCSCGGGQAAPATQQRREHAGAPRSFDPTSCVAATVRSPTRSIRSSRAPTPRSTSCATCSKD